MSDDIRKLQRNSCKYHFPVECKHNVDENLCGVCKHHRFEMSDRESLEWLVFWCLSQDDPCISIGRGKELLGYEDMNDMRDWINKKIGNNK